MGKNHCTGLMCKRYFLFSVISLFCGLAKAQECKILEKEDYARPLFSLSRFYHDCNARKYEAEATWNFAVVHEGKETSYKQFAPQKSVFEIETDSEFMYDCSKKRYHAADSQISIRYSFYADADALSIQIGNRTFENSTIDGGNDIHLGQLCQRFRDKGDGKEVLLITVIDDMKLYERKKGAKRMEELEFLTLKRGSTFAFAVSY